MNSVREKYLKTYKHKPQKVTDEYGYLENTVY